MSIKAGTGLVVGSVLFGLGGLIVAFVPLGSYALVFWRLLVSSLIFGIWVLVSDTPARIPKKSLWLLMLSGALLALDLALWHESIRTIGVGISTLLNSLQVFFLAFIGLVYFGERPNFIKVLSLLLAVFGIALIGSPEFSQNPKALFGFVTGIVSGGALAVSMTLLKQAQKHCALQGYHLSLACTMVWVGLGGLVLITPLTLMLDIQNFLPKTVGQIGAVFVYGAVMQCLAWGMIAYAIPRLSLATTGLLLLCEPIAALVIDAFWLNKAINLWQWCGAMISLFAIFLGSTKS